MLAHTSISRVGNIHQFRASEGEANSLPTFTWCTNQLHHNIIEGFRNSKLRITISVSSMFTVATSKLEK